LLKKNVVHRRVSSIHWSSYRWSKSREWRKLWKGNLLM